MIKKQNDRNGEERREEKRREEDLSKDIRNKNKK